MAAFTKGTVTVVLRPLEPGFTQELDGFITSSGRWAAVEVTRKNWATIHVPTGVAARNGLSYTGARKLALLLEEVGTPALDQLTLGQLAGTADEIQDLRALGEVIFEFVRAQ